MLARVTQFAVPATTIKVPSVISATVTCLFALGSKAGSTLTSKPKTLATLPVATLSSAAVVERSVKYLEVKNRPIYIVKETEECECKK